MTHFWNPKSVVAWKIEPSDENNEQAGEGPAVDGESVPRGVIDGLVLPKAIRVYADMGTSGRIYRLFIPGMDLIHDFFNGALFAYRSKPSAGKGSLSGSSFTVTIDSDKLVVRPQGSTTITTDVLQFEDVIAVNHGDLTMHITVLEAKPKSCMSRAGRRRRDIYLRREEPSNILDLASTAFLHHALGDLDEMVNSAECPTRTRMLVLVNPASGKGQAEKLYREYAAPLFKLASDRFIVETVMTVSSQHIRHLGMDNADKYDAFVTCGGDGGIYQLPDWQYLFKHLKLGMLPGGSGNGLSTSAVYASEKDFYGDIEGFVGDFNAAMRLILRGKTTPLDGAIIKSGGSAGGESCIGFLNGTWGFFSDVDIESEKYRFIGEARFTLYGLWRILRLRHYQGRISYILSSDMKGREALKELPLDDSPLWTTEEGDFAGVWLNNLSHSAPNLLIAPDQRLNDGQWSLRCPKREDFTFSKFAKSSASVSTGKNTDMAPSWVEKCVVAWKIEPADDEVMERGVGFCIDGEIIPRGEVAAYVSPGLLHVYAEP
ncbi:Sphingosine kinase 2 [Perkinsus chesapeaki]|uniref:Sphingosine kinase 2 n=1 Tax=Perkinsus chesapeaki TaxID=330153 RepID=A0A7J6MFL6_PERCH|nr:Sphingosine kinase 2 [Perkinsus chesapeaki]